MHPPSFDFMFNLVTFVRWQIWKRVNIGVYCYLMFNLTIFNSDKSVACDNSFELKKKGLDV